MPGKASEVNDLAPLAVLSWRPEDCAESLAAVFDQVTGEARAAIAWYPNKTGRKRRTAMALRVGAVIATAGAGVMPILAQMGVGENGAPILQPAWASVSLAVAAALVGLDHYFGFSSGWMRFVATELQLRQQLLEFQMEWATERASWKGASPTDDQVQRVLSRAKAFVLGVSATVLEETNTWIAEFQTTLKQLDEAAKAKAAVSELGGVNLVVTNGDACDGGWTLCIDGGSRTTRHGKTAAAVGLRPGMHTVLVEGVIQAKARRAELVTSVPAGGTAQVEATLD